MQKRFFSALGALATSVLSQQAMAQDEPPSLQLNQYEQPVAGDAFFSVPAPWVGGHLEPRAAIAFDYASEPLVLVDENDNVIATPVSSQAYLHLGFSFALWDRLGISINFPVAVAQSGDEALSTAPALQAADGAQAGDLRLGLRGRLLGEYYDAFQLGLGAYIYVPTGPEGGYTGEGDIYGKPQLLLGGRVPHFVWSASAGSILRGSNNPHTFTYSVGVGVVVVDDTLQLGPELFGAVALEDKPLFDGTGTTPLVDRKGSVNMELLLGAKYRFLDSFVVGLAAGPGLSNGVGTPQYRIVGTLGYDPQPPKDKPKPKAKPKDRDGDGIVDRDDACPKTPGVANDDPAKNGCPPDKDGDGIIDSEDACPDRPGEPNDDPEKHGCPPPGDRDNDGIMDPDDACIDVSGEPSDDPEQNGCPPDQDGDGIYDKDDACPDVPGVKNKNPKLHGCPPDKDGDGILDADDACIDVPGVADKDPKKNGCPKVIVTDKEIKILEKIEFDFDRATIKPVSDPIIDAVAKVMTDNPEIRLIEIQGHTDNKGSPFYNRLLSDRRAKAVKDALIKRGVSAKRLRSKGYGQAQPIADNDSNEGRATNRRVQFKIIKRRKKRR